VSCSRYIGLFDSRNKSRYNQARQPKTNREEVLNTQRIVSERKAERNRSDKAIAALDGDSTIRATVAKNAISMDGAHAPRKRDHLTAAGRKRLSMLMKKRWAEKRKKSSFRKQNNKAA
jgi:hypothetical protein